MCSARSCRRSAGHGAQVVLSMLMDPAFLILILNKLSSRL